jgi:hypothetical protein
MWQSSPSFSLSISWRCAPNVMKYADLILDGHSSLDKYKTKDGKWDLLIQTFGDQLELPAHSLPPCRRKRSRIRPTPGSPILLLRWFEEFLRVLLLILCRHLAPPHLA